MIARLAFLGLALLLGHGVSAALAEDPASYRSRGDVLAKAGKLEQALPYYLLALETAEQALGPDAPELAPLLEVLAAAHSSRGQYPDAEPFYERAVALREGAVREHSRGLATALTGLGRVYEATGRGAEAVALYQRALALGVPALGPDHPSLHAARRRLADLAPLSAEAIEPAPLAQEAAADPPARIHLISIRDPARAAEEWQRLKAQHADLLVGLELVVTRADLGPGRGVYYRLQAGPLDRAAARTRCAAFEARGVYCRLLPAPGRAPAPREPTTVAGRPEELASLAPLSAPAFRVHLTSIRNPADSAEEWSRLQRLYPTLLGGLSLAIERADLGPERGVYYRIQAGSLSQEAARRLCMRFSRKGVWCDVIRPEPGTVDRHQAQLVRRGRRRAEIGRPAATRRPRHGARPASEAGSRRLPGAR